MSRSLHTPSSSSGNGFRSCCRKGRRAIRSVATAASSRQRDFESPSHRHTDASVEIRTPYSAGAYQTGEIQGALLVGGADGHEPVRVDDPLRDRPEPSPSAVTSPEGRPAPRATSGRRARRPPRPTPPVSSSRFSRPRWRRRPVASSPGAAVGRRCLLDAR